MSIKKYNIQDFDTILHACQNISIAQEQLEALLPQAKIQDGSIYLQIMSQIALMQALQGRYKQAHATLDQADSIDTDHHLPRIRILLERGRVFQQQGNIDQAQNYFKQAYQLSLQYDLDYYTIDAAHMIAIIVNNLEEKIEWNQKALALVLETDDIKAQLWKASLYNNLGQNYFDLGDYEQSLDFYQHSLAHRIEQDDILHQRLAQWAIGRCLRLLERFNQALLIQKELCDFYEQNQLSNEMHLLCKGFVYEELAELYLSEQLFDKYMSKKYALLAFDILSKNTMFVTTSSERLNRLQILAN